MEIAIDSFALMVPDGATGVMPSTAERMERLLNEIVTADRSGVDLYGVGEHHRADFIDASPAVVLAAGAARTSRIRLTSAVSVLNAADPVRLFQDFATLDIISNGRAEIIVGRGSFGEAHALFGVRPEDYDDAFAEKLDLLIRLRAETNPHWRGRFRPALTGQGVYPRPVQPEMPVWLGVGGTPQSFARAGTLGLPLMIAIIGGSFDRFRPLVDLYREAGRRAGHARQRLRVGVHAFGFVGDTTKSARATLFPGWFRMATQMSRERGFRAPSEAQFEAEAGPHGAMLVGGPEDVAAKLRATSEILGSIDRVSFQMSMAADNPMATLRAIELLGQEVRPLVKST
jgi:probable LLM family oxidoreductase